MPRFSLVIPTLQRSDTLQHSLATLVNQSYDDFEIVVQNNGRDSATEVVIESFDNPRIRHFWSDSVLPMAKNWELALANATGEFITFVGDDDGLFPDACRIAAGVLARTDAEIVSWRPFVYNWQSFIFPKLQNRLVADVDYDVKIQLISSRSQLRKFYRFELHYAQLPMIYNSFVARNVVERVKSRAECYFLGVNPDVTSGIVNAACTKEFALITRPLSIAGLSGHSTGHKVTLSPPNWISAEQVKRDLGKSRIDPRLVPANNNLEIMLAGDALLVRDCLFSDDLETEFDFRRLIQSVASAINDRPGFYDATRAAIGALAQLHGIPLSDIALPAASTDAVPPLSFGAVARGSSQIFFVLDGNALGLNGIDDAIRLMDQLIPRVEDVAALQVELADTLDRAVVKPGVKVSFCAGGDGVTGLGYGWAVPERWGTWSVGKQANLRLVTLPAGAGLIHAEFSFRSFLHAEHPRVQVGFWIGGMEIAALIFDDARPKRYRLVIPPGSCGAGGSIDLELRIANPCSPRELGVSADARQLGIGLEWMRVQPG